MAPVGKLIRTGRVKKNVKKIRKPKVRVRKETGLKIKTGPRQNPKRKMD